MLHLIYRSSLPASLFVCYITFSQDVVPYGLSICVSKGMYRPIGTTYTYVPTGTTYTYVPIGTTYTYLSIGTTYTNLRATFHSLQSFSFHQSNFFLGLEDATFLCLNPFIDLMLKYERGGE